MSPRVATRHAESVRHVGWNAMFRVRSEAYFRRRLRLSDFLSGMS